MIDMDIKYVIRAIRRRQCTAGLVGILAALAASSNAAAQTINAPGDHELHPVWGAQNQVVHTHKDGNGDLRTLVGCGGGLIRRQFGTAAPEYVSTPSDFTGTVIDIAFLESDSDIGFACGRNGRLLKTTDGGLIWNTAGIDILDPCMDKATCWSVLPLTEDHLIVVGLWLSRVTTDGGATWSNLTMKGIPMPGAPLYGGANIPEGDFHFYAVDGVGDGTRFRAAICAEWEVSPTDSRGVVFYTDSAEPGSNNGNAFRMTLDDSVVSPMSGSSMPEPWALEYERGSSVGSATINSYVTGGEGANHPGRVYSSTNGGMSWSLSLETGTTPYSVSVEPGRVYVGAYSGTYHVRIGTTWRKGVLPGPTIPGVYTALNGKTTPALQGLDSADTNTLTVSGGWGMTMRSLDGGTTWTNVNPHQESIASGSHIVPDLVETRLQALEVKSGNVWVGGQFGQVGKTSDGGATFDWVQVPNPETVYGIDFFDTSDGVAVGPGGSAWYTTNGGTSWTVGMVIDPLGIMGSVPTSRVQFRDVDSFGTQNAIAVGWYASGGAIIPAVAFTRDGGEYWYMIDAPGVSPLNHGVRLLDVLRAGASEGLVVGYEKVSGTNEHEAKAYKFSSFSQVTGAITWDDVSPPHQGTPPASGRPASRKLLGVDGVGSNLASLTAYVVGNEGMILKWNGGTSVLDDIPGVFELERVGSGTVLVGDIVVQTLITDLDAIAVSPSGNRVLAGGHYDIDLRSADDLGWMLELDGSWNRIRAHSGKDLLRAVLTSDTDGFVLGQSQSHQVTGVGKRLDGCSGYNAEDVISSGFNNPNLGDPSLLRYLGN